MPSYFDVYEDVGNLELCIKYTLRDDLPQTVNLTVRFHIGNYVCKFIMLK